MDNLKELYERGAKIGLITQSHNQYNLLEFAVAGILPGPNGGTVQGPFMPTSYTVEEVADNTALLLHDRRLVLVMRPFISSIPDLRERVCRWIQWANENSNDVRNVLNDPVVRTEEE